MEQLEEKINTELAMLKEKTATMEKELEIYSDLSSLKEEAEKKRRVGVWQDFIHEILLFKLCLIYTHLFHV